MTRLRGRQVVRLPGRRRDAPAELRRVEAHRDAAVARVELHQDRGGPVVAEDQLGAAPGDRRLASHRVARDVELVRLVGDELDPGEECGVEERRRDLADAAADGILEAAVEDLRGGDEALRLGALAERAVEREHLAGQDDRAVEQRRRTLDVRHARRTAGVVRRELGDELRDPELLAPPRSSASAGR